MTSPNLSHYYISKKPLLVSQSFGRLVLAVWSWADWQNFERLVMVFLKYKNGSNLERSLLSTIQSYVANPSKMKNFLITLLYKTSDYVTVLTEICLHRLNLKKISIGAVFCFIWKVFWHSNIILIRIRVLTPILKIL